MLIGRPAPPRNTQDEVRDRMVLALSRNSQNIGLRGYPIHTMGVHRPSGDVAFTLSDRAAA